jgi:CDP-paratose 2-epimerase
MKVLITGSLGLVGSAAMKFFADKGYEVIGIDTNRRSEFFGTRVQKDKTSLPIDITDEKAINGLFSIHSFDVIIHAAAQPSHDWAKDHVLTDFDVNARGTVILLEATRAYCPNATFIYVSTDKVYGENMERLVLSEKDTRWHNTHPYAEDLGLDFAKKRSLFGCSKTAADIYVQEYGNYFGMNTVCFRPGCITGKNHQGAEQHGFLAYLAKCIKEEKTYKIFGFNGKQVRDQIHSHDLAAAFWEFAQKPQKGAVYNIGGGPERSVSVLEAISMIEKETGKKASYEFYEGRDGDRQWDVHDVTKFQEDYPDWKYSYSLNDIIKDICSTV